MFTNNTAKGDLTYHAINSHTKTPCSVSIASAFFTYPEPILEMTKRSCKVRLIVRLCFPTSPAALKTLINTQNVDVRYYTSTDFHPKLYIFGDHTALVGSANLTMGGVRSNQEISVTIQSNDHRFDELKCLFEDYWSHAKALTSPDLAQYESIYNAYNKSTKGNLNIERVVIENFGDINFPNITRDKRKVKPSDAFAEDFNKSYQGYLTSFNTIAEVFKSAPLRKFDEHTIPLHIEIDSFISFVRHTHVPGDSWKDTPIIHGEEQSALIRRYAQEWRTTPWPYFEDTVVKDNYPTLKSTFSSVDSINNASLEQIIAALDCSHAFQEQLRFTKGGKKELHVQFLTLNDLSKIKETLAYLLFGEGDYVKRMANTLYNPSYKLRKFGRACVQELVGWLNQDGLPIVNGRTTKIMRYLGFEVLQL